MKYLIVFATMAFFSTIAAAEIVDIAACAGARTKQSALSLDAESALLVQLPNGAKAVIQLSTIRPTEGTYHWKFRATPTSKVVEGVGRVFEDFEKVVEFPPGVTMVRPHNTADGLYITAGDIKLAWSAHDANSGYVYFCEDRATVQLIPAKDYVRKF